MYTPEIPCGSSPSAPDPVSTPIASARSDSPQGRDISMKQLGSFVAALMALAWLGAAPAGDPDVPERYMSVDEAKALVDQNKRVLFIDVRVKSQFDEQHIRGARNIPLRDLPRRLGEIPRRDLVVLY
jgi:hypothetical protein